MWQGMTELAFLSDEKTQDAVVRNFEILGEAANNIEKFRPAYAKEHADVPVLRAQVAALLDTSWN